MTWSSGYLVDSGSYVANPHANCRFVESQPSRTTKEDVAVNPLVKMQLVVCRGCVLLLGLLLFSGCMVSSKLQSGPDELHNAIRNGEIVKQGDNVVLETASGAEVSFVIEKIGENTIHGEGQVVRIEDIVSLQKRAYSPETEVVVLAAGALLVATLVLGLVASVWFLYILGV